MLFPPWARESRCLRAGAASLIFIVEGSVGMAKLRVAVLFGGVSSEHEVSCRSASAIINNLSKDKYEIYKVGITKKGNWRLYPGDTEGMADGSWEHCMDCVPAILSPDRTTHGLVLNHSASFDVIKLDVVFPVLHGRNGEDGTVQGLMDLAGIPYVGCHLLSSAACMDKAFANQCFVAAGIPHTPWVVVHRHELRDFEEVRRRVEAELEYPVFVKPAVGGSSVGVTKVKTGDELHAALQLATAHDHKIVVEQGVVGQEVESAVLGNQNLLATLPGEVVSCNEIYDYEAKYESGDSSQIFLPARLSQEKLEEVRDWALKAYRAMECTGLARVDFFVEEGTGRVLLNEINTLPGFTSISQYPMLMNMSGVDFPELCDRLIDLAIERAEG